MKKILLIHSDLLLSAGVESLLSGDDEFSIKGTEILDKTGLNEELKFFQPDIVIMDESLSLTDPPFFISLLSDYPKTHLIIIKIHENQLNVYNRMEFPVSCVEDLLSVVREC